MHNVSNRLDFFMYRGFTTRHLLFNKYLKKRANITDSLYIDLHSDIASLGETIEPDVSYPKKLANATYYIIGNLGTPPEYTNKYGTLTCTQGAIFTREKLGGIENSSIKARLELLLPGE